MRLSYLAAGLATILATPAVADDLRLEPSINGAVSSSGRFVSQAAEGWYLAQQRIADEVRAEHELAVLHQAALDPQLEPCLNGGVSPNGLFATAELEDIADRFASGAMRERLEDSAYLGAIVDGVMPAAR